MSIYRKTYRDKKGKLRRSRSFTAEFHFNGKLHRKSGFVDYDHADHWASSEKLSLRRGATGYVKAMHKAQAIPLITEFAATLRKDTDAMYAYTSEKRLLRLAGECGWRTLGDVTAESLEKWQASETKQKDRIRKAGERTKNQYVQIAQQWGAWLVRPAHKLPANPLSDVRLLKARHNDAYRRAGTVEELDKLLATCSAERRLAYLFRIYTPIRRKSVKQMTWKMLHLDATPPYVLLPANINKSRRDEKFPIRYDIAGELRKAKRVSRSGQNGLVFPNLPTLDDLREDLAGAGVRFGDEKGNRRLDFHALRRTLVRIGKLSGLTLDQVSLLLGHKDARTTKKYYDDDGVEPIFGEMVEKLPTLGQMRRGA